MNTTWLVISAVACAAALAGGLAVIFSKKHRPDGSEKVVLREAPITLVMAVFLIGLGFAVLVLKYLGYEVGGTNDTSYQFCAWFSFVCTLMGVYSLLFTFVKKVLAFEDRMVIVDLLGRGKTVYWRDVTRVKTNLISRRLVFYVGEDGNTVNGEAESYRKFVRLANQNVPAHVASDTLGNLDLQLNRENSALRNRRK